VNDARKDELRPQIVRRLEQLMSCELLEATPECFKVLGRTLFEEAETQTMKQEDTCSRNVDNVGLGSQFPLHVLNIAEIRRDLKRRSQVHDIVIPILEFLVIPFGDVEMYVYAALPFEIGDVALSLG
jgi:hypothetical protein